MINETLLKLKNWLDCEKKQIWEIIKSRKGKDDTYLLGRLQELDFLEEGMLK